MTIRAKFRCLKISHDYQGYVEVQLRAVMNNKGQCEENRQFFDSTPNGEANFTLRGACPFTPGVFYYIDMDPLDEKPVVGWQLYQASKQAGETGSVNLQPICSDREQGEKEHAPLWGSLKMDLTKPRVLALFGEPGRFWRVVFTAAPADPE